MPKLVTVDRSKRSLPPTVGGDPYICEITGMQPNLEHSRVEMFINPIEGEYKDCYKHTTGIINCVYLKYGDPGAENMTRKRLSSITASNEGFDAMQAFENDDFESFIGKRCGIHYKVNETKKNAQLETMTHSVVAVPPKGEAVHNNVNQAPIAEHVDVSPITNNKGMTLFVDDRQKEGKHDEKHQALKDMGITLETVRLDIGDYQVAGLPVSVDTKRNVGELADNLTIELNRFANEVKRAHDAGFKLYIVTTLNGELSEVTHTSLEGWTHPRCRDCAICNCKVGACPLDSTPIASGANVALGMDYLSKEYSGSVFFLFVQNEIQSAEMIAHLLGFKN